MLFNAPPDGREPFILNAPETIFYAQGGGQPSDTGVIVVSHLTSSSEVEQEYRKWEGQGEGGSQTLTLHVHQVRKIALTILHLVTHSPSPSLSPSSSSFPSSLLHPSCPPDSKLDLAIDIPTRRLHSRIHTAGHVIGLAVNILQNSLNPPLPKDLRDSKASHYPSAAFVEFHGLIPGTAKSVIQHKVDELVGLDLGVGIYFWTEEKAAERCIGGQGSLEGIQGDEDGVRVVEIGEGEGREGLGNGMSERICGSYPCGGTHVGSLKELGKVVVRGIKRQKGISKISYEIADA